MTTCQHVFSDLRSIVGTTRVFNTRSMILFFLISQSLSRFPLRMMDQIAICLIFLFTYSIASCLNYLADSEIDRYNQRETPISWGLSPQVLRSVVGISFVGTAACVLQLGSFSAITAAGGLLIAAILYSSPWFHLSHQPWPKLLLMTTTYTLIPIWSGIGGHASSVSLPHLLFLSGLALYYSSWLMYSDIKDIAGDTAYRKITIAVRYGVPATVRLAAVLGGMGVLGIVVANPQSTIPVLLTGSLWCLQLLMAFQPELIYRPLLRRVGGYLLLGSLLSIWMLLATNR